MFSRWINFIIRSLINLFYKSWLFVRNRSLAFTKEADMESDDECEYDSTWEDEIKTTRRKQSYRMSRRNLYAARDMQDFRHSCRNLLDDVNSDETKAMKNKQSAMGRQMYRHNHQDYDYDAPDEGVFFNLEFYTGGRKSRPDNFYIDDFHKYWKGDYDRLEHFHGYIQWLFPIQEQGVNWEAHVLTKEEIKLFRESDKAMANLVKSYKVMLDFYGIRLVDERTGELERSDNWEERFDNLNRNTHNNLRITRILKCLATLGLQHYQVPLVKFFLHETLKNKQLPKVKASVLDYFMFAVLDREDRKKLVSFAYSLFQDKSKFVWGPRKILQGNVVNKDGENAHGENERSSAALNAHGENERSSAALNAHGENERSSAAENAHRNKNANGAAVYGYRENNASSAPVNVHKESETNSDTKNVHRESETTIAPENNSEKQDEEPNISGTSYPAKHHKNDSTLEIMTGKQNGKRDSQVQAQQSTELAN